MNWNCITYFKSSWKTPLWSFKLIDLPQVLIILFDDLRSLSLTFIQVIYNKYIIFIYIISIISISSSFISKKLIFYSWWKLIFYNWLKLIFYIVFNSWWSASIFTMCWLLKRLAFFRKIGGILAIFLLLQMLFVNYCLISIIINTSIFLMEKYF